MTDTFRPTGDTVVIAATVAGVSAQVSNTTQASEYMIINMTNSDTIWVAIGFEDPPVCTIPVAGTPGTAFPVRHGLPAYIISAWPNAFFTAKTTSGTHELTITPGEAVR